MEKKSDEIIEKLTRRKIFFIFLVKNSYIECYYIYNEKKSKKVKFVQNAIVEAYNDEFDKKYILCTKTAKDNNYNFLLNESGYEFDKIDISEEISEKGIWEIFQQMYDILEENDEIVFDITHSFRFMPMLGITLLQMAKFLKNVKVEKIFYGAYEQSKFEEKNGEFLLLDLSSFSALQNWILSGNLFVKAGRAEDFPKLTRENLFSVLRGNDITEKKEAENLTSIAESMKEITENFRANRGENIITAKEIKNLNEKISKMEEGNLLKPFRLIIEYMKKDIEKFKENSLNNLFHAVVWCIDKGLIQQGLTILQEGILTILMEQAGKKNKIYNEDERQKLSGKIRKKEEDKENNKEINEFKNIDSIIEIYEELTNDRNDINHSGFRKNRMRAKKFEKKLKKHFLETQEILFNKEEYKLHKIEKRKALLVFSHQLTENQEKELNGEYNVKQIEKLPDNLQNIWSNVTIGESYKENLEKIKEYISKNFYIGDILVIQGNWGYTYNLVKWAIENEYLPVYSYTERNVEEIKDGEDVKKISYFRHVKFLKYE